MSAATTAGPASGRLNGLSLYAFGSRVLQQISTESRDVSSSLAFRGGHAPLVLQADSLGELHQYRCGGRKAGQVVLSHLSSSTVSHRPLLCVAAWDNWGFFATSKSILARHLGVDPPGLQTLSPAVSCSSLAVDAQQLMLLGGTRNGAVARWHLTSLDLPGEMSDEAHLGPVRGLAAGEDGCQYSVAMDGLICCWDFQRMGGKAVGQSQVKQPGLTCLCSSGNLLGAGSKEGTLLVYDIRQLSHPSSSVPLSSSAPVRAICWRPASAMREDARQYPAPPECALSTEQAQSTSGQAAAATSAEAAAVQAGPPVQQAAVQAGPPVQQAASLQEGSERAAVSTEGVPALQDLLLGYASDLDDS